MIIKIHGTLHLAMETAIEKNLIAKNPTEGTTVPKKKKKDLKVLNDSELDKLMQALNDDKEWGDADIYDPSSGKIYDVDIEFKDAKTLEVYGNIWGIGKTVYWKKIK